MRKLTLILLGLVSCLLMAQAPQPGPEDWFDQGLKAYQTKNWDQARDNFEKALQNHPGEASIFYNLGLTYFELNKRGYAAGYWRKALRVQPGLNAAAIALGRADEKYHFSRLERSPWALFIHDSLARFDWNTWLALLAIAGTSFSWLWLAYFQKRKSALLTETEELPPVGLRLIFVSLIAVLVFAGVAGKWLDDQKLRATVVTSTAELKSAPSNDGVVLAPVTEASEVEIAQTHEDWYQVVTGDGVTGWVKKTDVLPTDTEGSL